jgi:tyrosyl-DNA phosphodiesterase-1
MSSSDPEKSRASKRQKLDAEVLTDIVSGITSTSAADEDPTSRLLQRPISPPLPRRVRSTTPTPSACRARHAADIAPNTKEASYLNSKLPTVASPVQLTRIADLASAQNVDTVGLDDILGDPMIKECWNFNFLFDVDFVMSVSMVGLAHG